MKMAACGLPAVTSRPHSASLGPTMIRLKLGLLKDRRFDWRHALRTLQCSDGAAIITSGHACNAQWGGVQSAHFRCLLLQSRNSWNSSGLAVGRLPATPSCFMKSLNFARSSGSCAFRSSHS
jgi:hypothetical protein